MDAKNTICHHSEIFQKGYFLMDISGSNYLKTADSVAIVDTDSILRVSELSELFERKKCKTDIDCFYKPDIKDTS